MSFYQSHTIDYYIIMHGIPTKTETFEETRCTNTECENHHKEMKEGVNFCPICGSKVDLQDVIETIKYDYLGDEFREDDGHIGHLYDWFFKVEYIDLLLGKDYEKIKLEESDNLLVCNGNFNVNSDEEFRNHPATKALLERIGECDIHYGLVLYQA